MCSLCRPCLPPFCIQACGSGTVKVASAKVSCTLAVTYVALVPKSNSALTTYAAARRLVNERGALPVPARYRPGSTSLDRAMGHGQGYKYPHDFAGHYVPEDYLPEELAGERIYRPSDSGFEAELSRRLAEIAERKRSR